MGKDARKRAARGGSRWRTALHVVAQVGTGPFRGAQANPGGDVFDEKPVFKHAVLPSIPAIFAGASAWRRFSCRSGDAISRSAGSGVGHREGQGPKVLQHYGQSNEDRAGVQAAADGGPAGNPRPFGRIHPRKGRGGAASDHNSHRGSSNSTRELVSISRWELSNSNLRSGIAPGADASLSSTRPALSLFARHLIAETTDLNWTSRAQGRGGPPPGGSRSNPCRSRGESGGHDSPALRTDTCSTVSVIHARCRRTLRLNSNRPGCTSTFTTLASVAETQISPISVPASVLRPASPILLAQSLIFHTACPVALCPRRLRAHSLESELRGRHFHVLERGSLSALFIASSESNLSFSEFSGKSSPVNGSGRRSGRLTSSIAPAPNLTSVTLSAAVGS